MAKCHLCGLEANSKADLAKHIYVFHPNLTEDERIRKANDNPVAFLKEHGFTKQYNLVKQGKCPVCERVTIMEEIKGMKELNEWRMFGLCGPCQRKRKTVGL